jgi:hypothetical protein
MSDDVGNAGYDELLESIAEDEGYYLSCPQGHGSLPPRRVCPECGESPLEEESLPATGTIETFTETRVATPQFEEDAPYVLAIAEFGPVRLTGQLRGRDTDELEVGQRVSTDVVTRETTEDPLLLFRPK